MQFTTRVCSRGQYTPLFYSLPIYSSYTTNNTQIYISSYTTQQHKIHSRKSSWPCMHSSPLAACLLALPDWAPRSLARPPTSRPAIQLSCSTPRRRSFAVRVPPPQSCQSPAAPPGATPTARLSHGTWPHNRSGPTHSDRVRHAGSTYCGITSSRCPGIHNSASVAVFR